MACTCARLASSGTTPPNTRWISWERMTIPPSRTSESSVLRRAADVSSHEVSMPRVHSPTAAPRNEVDAVRLGPRRYSRRADDLETHSSGPHRVGAVHDDEETVGGEAREATG